MRFVGPFIFGIPRFNFSLLSSHNFYMLSSHFYHVCLQLTLSHQHTLASILLMDIQCCLYCSSKNSLRGPFYQQIYIFFLISVVVPPVKVYFPIYMFLISFDFPKAFSFFLVYVKLHIFMFSNYHV